MPFMNDDKKKMDKESLRFKNNAIQIPTIVANAHSQPVTEISHSILDDIS